MVTTIEIRLKASVLQQIRENQDLKNRLQLEMKISHSTLYRLLNSNSDRFTTASALKTISEVLGKTNDELLEA